MKITTSEGLKAKPKSLINGSFEPLDETTILVEGHLCEDSDYWDVDENFSKALFNKAFEYKIDSKDPEHFWRGYKNALEMLQGHVGLVADGSRIIILASKKSTYYDNTLKYKYREVNLLEENSIQEEKKMANVKEGLSGTKDIAVSSIKAGVKQAAIEQVGDSLVEVARKNLPEDSMIQFLLEDEMGQEAAKLVMAMSLIMANQMFPGKIPKGDQVEMVMSQLMTSSTRRISKPQLAKISKAILEVSNLVEEIDLEGEGDFAKALAGEYAFDSEVEQTLEQVKEKVEA